MTLKKLSSNVYSSDKGQSLNTALAQIEFITANKDALLKLRNGKETLEKFNGIINNYKSTNHLTDNQKSFIDVIYEKTMKGLGFDSYLSTYKLNCKKHLRYK